MIIGFFNLRIFGDVYILWNIGLFYVLIVNYKRGRERISYSNYVILSSIIWLIYYIYSLFCIYKILSFRFV